MADDFGRFESRASLVRSHCFPLKPEKYTDGFIQDCLGRLKENHLIDLYEENGRSYGVFLNFIKHQGKPRATRSKYPDPPSMRLQASASRCTQMHADENKSARPITNALVSVSVSESVSVNSNPSPLSSAETPSPHVPATGTGSPEVEGKRTTTRSRREPGRPWPKDFLLADDMRRFAENEGIVDCEREFANFHDKAIARGYRYIDWEAAWRNWVRSELTPKKKASASSVLQHTKEAARLALQKEGLA